MPSNQGTMDTFFQIVSDGTQNVTGIQNLFVSDTSSPPLYPNVGLTTGGPQFTLQHGVGILFTALYASFPSLKFSRANTVRPTDGNTISVEAVLITGAHAEKWAPKGAPASPPISLIEPVGNGSTLPVCAVFLFDGGSHKIQNLALYFDRWQLTKDLWDRAHPPHIDH